MMTTKQIKADIVAISAELGFPTTPRAIAGVYHNYLDDHEHEVNLDDAMRATYGDDWDD